MKILKTGSEGYVVYEDGKGEEGRHFYELETPMAAILEYLTGGFQTRVFNHTEREYRLIQTLIEKERRNSNA